MTRLGKMKKEIRIPYNGIRNMSVFYLLISFALFLATWIRAVIAIPALILLGCGAFACMKRQGAAGKGVRMRLSCVFLIFFAALFWCFTAGIGGFFYQSPDHHYRNAVFRDLIFHRWPVVYQAYDTGMVYYLGIWMVPALFGKALLWAGMEEELVWTASGAALLLWCGIGVTFLMLLLCIRFRQNTVHGIVMLLVIMTGFSGLDIVGEVWKNGFNIHDHIEWWSGYFQFRSHTTALFWAYNQAVPCWLMTMLLLSEADLGAYGMIVCSALFYTPFAAAGIGVCAAVLVMQRIRHVWKRGKERELFGEIFSCANVTAALVTLPVLTAYYSCNAGCRFHLRFCFGDYGGLTKEMAVTWIVFFFLEAGIYLGFTAKNEYKNPLFYAVILSLAVCSFVAVGGTGEVVFQLNAAMPALFLMMLFVMKTILEEKKKTAKSSKIYGIAFSAVMALGIVTPLTEYGRAVDTIRRAGTLSVTADEIKTLDTDDAPQNFIGLRISDSFFGQYMMR